MISEESNQRVSLATVVAFESIETILAKQVGSCLRRTLLTITAIGASKIKASITELLATFELRSSIIRIQFAIRNTPTKTTISYSPTQLLISPTIRSIKSDGSI